MAEDCEISECQELLMEIKNTNKKFFIEILPQIGSCFPQIQEKAESLLKFDEYLDSLPHALRKDEYVNGFNKALENKNYSQAKDAFSMLIHRNLPQSIELF